MRVYGRRLTLPTRLSALYFSFLFVYKLDRAVVFELTAKAAGQELDTSYTVFIKRAEELLKVSAVCISSRDLEQRTTS